MCDNIEKLDSVTPDDPVPLGSDLSVPAKAVKKKVQKATQIDEFSDRCGLQGGFW